jgi:branched-chain amino acid transport system substrate-binding protein
VEYLTANFLGVCFNCLPIQNGLAGETLAHFEEMDVNAKFWIVGLGLAAGSWASNAQDLVIGQVASMSGSNGADLGQGLQLGLRLAIEQTNQAGGVFGRKLRLAVRDDKYVPDETVRLTRELIEQDKPIALAGYRGTANTIALVKSGVLTEVGIPLVGTLTGAGEVQGTANIFHVRTSYRDEITQIVNQLSQMSQSRIGLFYADDAFGKAGREALENALNAQGRKPVAVAAYDKAPDKVASTIDAAVTQLVAAEPQALVIVAVGEPVYEFVKRVRAKSSSIRLVSMSVVDPAVVAEKVGLNYAHGIGFAQAFPYPYNDKVKMVREYRAQLAKQGTSVKPNYFSLEGYVSGLVLIEALKRAGPNPTRAKLLDSLARLPELDLGGFFVKFDPKSRNGSRFTELTVIARDGKLMR